MHQKSSSLPRSQALRFAVGVGHNTKPLSILGRHSGVVVNRSAFYCGTFSASRLHQPLLERGTLFSGKRKVNMPWNGTNGFSYNRTSVIANAPEASGVYALFNQGVWVYIGEAQNIRDRLLQHLTNEQNVCVAKAHPQWFAYELLWPAYRVARQDGLILELNPTCNKCLG